MQAKSLSVAVPEPAPFQIEGGAPSLVCQPKGRPNTVGIIPAVRVRASTYQHVAWLIVACAMSAWAIATAARLAKRFGLNQPNLTVKSYRMTDSSQPVHHLNGGDVIGSNGCQLPNSQCDTQPTSINHH
jgi:hypothetical protein